MATDATTRRTGRTGDGGTTLGPSRNILAVLGYLFNLVGALALLVFEDDGFVRHHAAQSLVFTGVVLLARFLASVVAAVLGLVPFVGGFLAGVVSAAVWLGAVAGYLFMAYRAYAGERYTLPGLGVHVVRVERLF